MNGENEKKCPPMKAKKEKKPLTPEEKRLSNLTFIIDAIESLATVAVVLMLVFAFIVRLNIVDGESMQKTLTEGEYLAVSSLFYEPTPGDIVIVHEMTAFPYDKPLVKRVIATAGQEVNIISSNDSWTLYVDGEPVDEPYRYVDKDSKVLHPEYSFPYVVPPNEVFVMGDNRNHSADSRTLALMSVDERCIVGKAVARISPIHKITVFKNPFNN